MIEISGLLFFKWTLWSFQYHILFILKVDLVRFAVDIVGFSMLLKLSINGFICDISKNKFGFLQVEAVKSM